MPDYRAHLGPVREREGERGFRTPKCKNARILPRRFYWLCTNLLEPSRVRTSHCEWCGCPAQHASQCSNRRLYLQNARQAASVLGTGSVIWNRMIRAVGLQLLGLLSRLLAAKVLHLLPGKYRAEMPFISDC